MFASLIQQHLDRYTVSLSDLVLISGPWNINAECDAVLQSVARKDRLPVPEPRPHFALAPGKDAKTC
jgi:hypothetical protein